MARVVVSHSTYIDGLINKLKILSKEKKIKTITPGRIAKTKGKTEKLNFKITTKVKGGFKVLARKGRSVQEIFIITDLDKEGLEDILSVQNN